jgi:hypothetical protein
MRVFLSHASEQKTTAEQVVLSLRTRGYTVFLDRDDLPAAQSFDERIEAGVAASDFMVFLISPESVTQGRYTLTASISPFVSIRSSSSAQRVERLPRGKRSAIFFRAAASSNSTDGSSCRASRQVRQERLAPGWGPAWLGAR